jgi:chromosome segregation ATPase
MSEVSQKIKLEGNLTTIESITDIEMLKAMYKNLNESYAESQHKADTLNTHYRVLREALDHLLSQSSLAGAVNDVKAALDSHADLMDSLATALQAQEVQVHTLSQRLDKLEFPALAAAAEKAEAERKRK